MPRHGAVRADEGDGQRRVAHGEVDDAPHALSQSGVLDGAVSVSRAVVSPRAADDAQVVQRGDDDDPSDDAQRHLLVPVLLGVPRDGAQDDPGQDLLPQVAQVEWPAGGGQVAHGGKVLRTMIRVLR